MSDTSLSTLAFFSSLLFLGCSAHVTSNDAAQESAAVSESPVIYFGALEVAHGQLKSADGMLPSRGSTVTLAAFMQDLAGVVCRDQGACLPMEAHVAIRYRGDQPFQDLDITQPSFVPDGPDVAWNGQNHGEDDVALQIPADADRVEVFAYFRRYHWDSLECVFDNEIGLLRCPQSALRYTDEGYVSNYGQNFRIDVR